MAGSRKNYLYLDDTGTQYAMALDESNTEAVNGNAGEIVVGTPFSIGLPRNIKPRVLFYSNTARTRTIRVIALTPTIYIGAITGASNQSIQDPIEPGGGVLDLVNYRGETRRLFRGGDSGLLDGDNP